MADGVAEQRLRPFQLADELFGIGVDEQFVGVETVALARRVGAVHAVAVDLAGMRIRQITVPDFVGVFGQFDAFEFHFAGFVEQAEFYLGGVRGKDREIHPKPIPGRAQWVG